MAVKIPLKLIFALIMVALIVIMIFQFFAQSLFGGEEYKATKDIADAIDEACGEDAPFKTNINVFLPDSKGVAPPDVDFFYVAVVKNNLLLAARRWGVEKNDYVAQFQDFLGCKCAQAAKYLTGMEIFKVACQCKEGNRVLKTIQLKNCIDNEVDICWLSGTEENCGTFQFESNEGKESLDFTIERLKTQTGREVLYLSYLRNNICGDKHCCDPESENSCPADCPQYECLEFTAE